MSKTDRMIYGAKCRCCEYIQVWDFGEASDKNEKLLNMYISEKSNNYCKNTYCENCKGMTIHDLLFYGRKSLLNGVIENLKLKLKL